VQHYDRLGQYEIALSKIDEAIHHTPTVIDLYSVKVCLYSFTKLFLVPYYINLFVHEDVYNRCVWRTN